jgi:hypothetical protein
MRFYLKKGENKKAYFQKESLINFKPVGKDSRQKGQV